MSWTDRKSIEHIKQIRNIFKVNTFVETGLYKGNNISCHMENFKELYSCEIDKKSFKIAKKKLQDKWLKDKRLSIPYDIIIKQIEKII